MLGSVDMAKRLFDLFVAAIALVLLSPVLLVVAVMVRLKLGKPIFYRAVRPGLNERLFTMVKFRTMTNATDEAGVLLSDEARTHPYGSWLRRTSLDELPELWNVVTGEMALVGPRPEIPEMLPYYQGDMLLKFSTRPGITGLAQISGRGRLGFYETVALDVDYVRRRSLATDVRIVLMTVRKMVTGDGAF